MEGFSLVENKDDTAEKRLRESEARQGFVGKMQAEEADHGLALLSKIQKIPKKLKIGLMSLGLAGTIFSATESYAAEKTLWMILGMGTQGRMISESIGYGVREVADYHKEIANRNRQYEEKKQRILQEYPDPVSRAAALLELEEERVQHLNRIRVDAASKAWRLADETRQRSDQESGRRATRGHRF